MKKTYILISLIFSAAVLGSFFLTYQGSAKKLSFDKLELADDPSKQAKGLMNRTDLCQSCGMLFVFENASVRNFWMKDTPTSLDIIFINEGGKIIKIHSATQPNSEQTYSSESAAQYALEAPAGYSQRNNLYEGQQINLSYLTSQAK